MSVKFLLDVDTIFRDLLYESSLSLSVFGVHGCLRSVLSKVITSWVFNTQIEVKSVLGKIFPNISIRSIIVTEITHNNYMLRSTYLPTYLSVYLSTYITIIKCQSPS